MDTPQSSDWNRFWSRNQSVQPAEVSWSKKRIMHVIAPYMRKGKKILDAGCGSGFFSRYFCDQGLQTVSLDYSDKALDMARQITQGRSRIIKHDLLSGDLAPAINEKFDIIFSDGLLEHFTAHDQDKIMANFISLLGRGGVLITFVPNRWSPWELIRPFFMPGIAETPFILKGLVRLKIRNGLAILESGGINTLPFALSPDKAFGRYFGMLLYAIAKKNE